MVHADPPRRSRIGWPTRRPPESLRDVPEHRHRTDRRQWVAIVGLYVVVALNSYLQILDHQYVLGRGQYRDVEQERLQQQMTEQFRAGMCDMLDGLPAGPLLDPKRAKYGCGPGIPRDQLSPDVQANLGELRGAQSEPGGVAVRPAPGTAAPSTAAAESYDRKRPRDDFADEPPTPAEPAPTSTPTAPTPPSGPRVDVSPLTDTVCDLTGICL